PAKTANRYWSVTQADFVLPVNGRLDITTTYVNTDLDSGTTVQTMRMRSNGVWSAPPLGMFINGRNVTGQGFTSLPIPSEFAIGEADALKLAITSVTSAMYGGLFNVTVQSQDLLGAVQNVQSTSGVSLSVLTGTGLLGGTTTGSILAGSNSVTITGVSY